MGALLDEQRVTPRELARRRGLNPSIWRNRLLSGVLMGGIASGFGGAHNARKIIVHADSSR
jgi:hypothetical protein